MRIFLRVSIFMAVLSIAITSCKDKKGGDDEEDTIIINNSELTINNLPNRPAQAYRVEVFQSGVEVTISNWAAVSFGKKGLAAGDLAANSGNEIFTLIEWDGQFSAKDKWVGTGTFPVVLLEVSDSGKSILKITEIQFDKGGAIVNYNELQKK